jgi:flavin reductase (DIM6/NTAB) family NADH-FMN oxidoreductase RutF
MAAAGRQVGVTGAPLLEVAAARFERLVAATVQAGTHTIVIGDVVAAVRGAAPAASSPRAVSSASSTSATRPRASS